MAVANPIVLADAQKYVTSILNADPTFAYTTSSSNRHIASEITQAILIADGKVCTHICNTPGHPRRSGFVSVQTIAASGNTITDTAGILSYVELDVVGGATTYQLASEATIEQVRRWRGNSSLYLSQSLPYYAITDGRIYYTTAYGAKVYTYTYSLTSACQAPNEYFSTVCHLALADLYAKEGDDLGASQTYYNMAAADLAAMGAGGA